MLCLLVVILLIKIVFIRACYNDFFVVSTVVRGCVNVGMNEFFFSDIVRLFSKELIIFSNLKVING